MQEFRQYPDGRVLALTGECPKGMKNLVFIGWTGTPDNLKEVAVPLGQLPPKIPDVPEEWKEPLKAKGFRFKEHREHKKRKGPRNRRVITDCGDARNYVAALTLIGLFVWSIVVFTFLSLV